MSNEPNTLADAISPLIEAEMMGEGLKTNAISSPANKVAISGMVNPPYKQIPRNKQVGELTFSVSDFAPSSI